MRLVAGIDSSTQSTKVELRDLESGRLVATGRSPHPATAPPVSEQAPESWWRALVAACEQVGPYLDQVAAVSVAGQQHGLVVIDGSGNVIRPAKLWNDTTSAPQAARLRQDLGPGVWAEACGLVPVASFTLTKLAWLAEHEPANLATVDRIMLPHDYLTWRLSGAHVTDRGDASGTAWWSPRSDTYAPNLLGLVVDPDEWLGRLPKVLGPRTSAGVVSHEAAIETSIAPGTPVAAGTGDNMAAALGLGLKEGDVAMSLGTSGTVYCVSSVPVSDPTGAVAGFADADGRYLPLVATLNATRVTDTVASWLGVDQSTMAHLALTAPQDPNVVLVPFFGGERSPNLPAATGVLTGLNVSTGRESIALAAHTGVVCSLLDGVESLSNTGVDTSGRLHLIGGGAKSPAYRRTVANLWARPITIPDSDELVAAGACLQAALMLARCEGTDDPTWDLSRGVTLDPCRDTPTDEIIDAYRVEVQRIMDAEPSTASEH